MSRAGLKLRVQQAVENDPSILVDRKDIQNTKGHSLSYLAMLGLTKMDMKKLERNGLAIRGYLPRTNQYGKRDGFEARYVLVADRDET